MNDDAPEGSARGAGNAKKANRPPAPTVTGTAELVLAPRIRRFATRRYLGAALVVAVLALAALVAVRELAVIEPMLAAEGANAARAVVYELPTGAELHVPIEPRTDVLRFVIHAYGRSDMALTPHGARMVLKLRGERASRTEELRADLPGLRSRVTAEDARVGVGDPTAVDVDVHDIGVGELIVTLADIASADGLLVRAYRREQLNEAEATLRETALDRAKKDELARWSWELGWDELTAEERVALLRARWRRVGALRGASTDLRSIVVAIAPPPTRVPPPAKEDLLGRVALRGDERIAMLVRPGARVHFLCDEATTLRASLRDANGAEQTTAASGQLEVGPFDDVRSVELGAARDVSVEVRSSDADHVEWAGWTTTYRATKSRPVIVDSPEADRVVRVSLRKPMARGETKPAAIAVTVELSGGGLPAPILRRFSANRMRSRVDRYQEFDSPEAPSERAWFFLALPRGSRARLVSDDAAPVDVSLAELDETAPPLPMPTRPADTPPPVFITETENTPSAFVSRRPSNAASFDATERNVLRTARWFAPAPPPPPANTVALAHAKHGDVRVDRGGKSFDSVARPFELEADPRRPLFVPIVAAFDAPTKMTVRVERDPAVRKLPSLFTRWTLPRTMDVGPRDMRATFVVGDDVPPGAKLRLRLSPSVPAARAAQQLVMLPWASARAAGPRWLGGAYEE